MARSQNEKTRDEQLINLLVGILTELKSLNTKNDNIINLCEEHWNKGNKK